MTNIIQITQTQINGADVNSVNSRDIYEYLDIATRYSMWIQRAIEKYDFEENIDFTTIITDPKSGKRDFVVSIDMAKELCMVSDTQKGKETRKYFIEAEKQLKQQNFTIPQSYAEALRLSADLAEKNTQLTQTIKNKDDVILAVADLNIKAGNVSFADFAKNLAIVNMGRNNVIKFCKARGYLRDNTEPYQPFVNRGYFVRKPSKEKINGEVRYTTFLTPRGTVWLTKIIKAEFELDDEEVA